MYNDKPFFSLIVPVYNIEKYIERTILSILNNDFDDYEIIVVNDGSTDKSLEIIQQYAGDLKLICITQDNGGLSAARNCGLQKARGEYVFFIDGDDFIKENALSVIYKALKDTEVDLLVFGRVENYEDRQIVPYQLRDDVFYSSEIYLKTSLCNSTFRTNVWDKIYRRDLIEKHNLRFVNGLLYEDMFFLLQYLSYSRKIKVISVPLYLYTLSNQNSITKILRRKDLDLLVFLDMTVKFIDKTKVLSKSCCYTMLQRFSLSSIVHKYAKVYKSESLAREIVDNFAFDKNFRKIVKYNVFHGLCFRDKFSAFLIRRNIRLYVLVILLLKKS